MSLRAKKRILVMAAGSRPAELIKGVQEFLLTHSGYQPIWLIYEGGASDIRHVGQMILRTRPHGILAPIFWATRSLLENIHLPLVNISDSTLTSAPMVIIDQRRVGQLAAQHLMAQGLRNYAYGSLKAGYYGELRWQGFRETLAKAGFSCFLLDDFYGRLSPGNVPDAIIRKWVAQLPKPVGVHLSFTILAKQVIWACQELGLNVPGDVAVLGGQDLPPMTTLQEPALSAFEFPVWRQCYEAMKLLHRLLQGEKPLRKPILIPPGELIQRQSTDRRAAGDPEMAHVLRLIRENAHQPFAVKDLLEHVPLSRRALERRFEKLTGHGLHEEIVRAHMDRAKTLLRETALPVGQVGMQSGFSSYAFFSASFREQEGQTPREYRRRSLDLE